MLLSGLTSVGPRQAESMYNGSLSCKRHSFLEGTLSACGEDCVGLLLCRDTNVRKRCLRSVL